MLHAVHRIMGHGHLATGHRLVLHGWILRQDGVRHDRRTEDDAQCDQ
jgi:hypothetical protein